MFNGRSSLFGTTSQQPGAIPLPVFLNPSFAANPATDDPPPQVSQALSLINLAHLFLLQLRTQKYIIELQMHICFVQFFTMID
jgi:hypothetical protein